MNQLLEIDLEFLSHSTIPSILELINDSARNSDVYSHLQKAIGAFLDNIFATLGNTAQKLSKYLDWEGNFSGWEIFYSPYLKVWCDGFGKKTYPFDLKEKLLISGSEGSLQHIKYLEINPLKKEFIQTFFSLFDHLTSDSAIYRAGHIYYYSQNFAPFIIKADKTILNCNKGDCLLVEAVWIYDHQRSFRYLWDEKLMLALLEFIEKMIFLHERLNHKSAT